MGSAPAIFDQLAQHVADDDVRLLDARAGDLVIIPPGYGHVTINPGGATLTMANIVSTRFESDYSLYERFHGAAYFELAGGRLVKNSRYPGAPVIRTVGAPEQPGRKFLQADHLYDLIGTDRLGFLNRPEDYPELFS